MRRFWLSTCGVLAVVMVGLACGEGADDPATEAGGCTGGGISVAADGVAACVYDPIIETGFRCPPSHPWQYVVSDAVVCATQEGLNETTIQQLVEKAQNASGGAGGDGGDVGSAGTGGSGGAGGSGGGCTTTFPLELVPPGVDVLVVVDNSGSMADDQLVLANHFHEVLDPLAQSAWQVGVTTTDVSAAGAAGRLVPVDGSRPRIVTPTTPDAEATLQANLTVGTSGDAMERGIEAAIRAVTPPLSTQADDPSTPEPNDGNLGFLRQEAHLAVIFVTDEDDDSSQTVADAYAALVSVKGDAARLSAFEIQPNCALPVTRYAELAQAAGGISERICDGNTAEAAYAAVGASIAGRLEATEWTGAAPIDLNGDGAIDDADVDVRVDGVVVPEHQGADRVWRWDATSNRLVFEEGYAPGIDAVVEIAAACP